MKNVIKVILVLLTFSTINACKKTNLDPLTNADKESLLFMLEEEKLARDTYEFLDNEWGISPFANIKKSEQSHMDAISNLLDQYKIAYTILTYGNFSNQDLQDYYDQFVLDGAVSAENALQIGATIEDLDIEDLEKYKSNTVNSNIIDVFDKLQCGSRNHLRSFISTIVSNGNTYSPQFLSSSEYQSIINGSNEQCGK